MAEGGRAEGGGRRARAQGGGRTGLRAKGGGAGGEGEGTGRRAEGGGRRAQGGGRRAEGGGLRAQGAGRRAQGSGAGQGAGLRAQGAGRRAQDLPKDLICYLRKKLTILVLMSEYGGYLKGRSNRFDFTSTDLWFENVSNDLFPWYLPMPLLPTPPYGR